jgi:RNA polymerase sigma-70 factor (ECF subfamily)
MTDHTLLTWPQATPQAGTVEDNESSDGLEQLIARCLSGEQVAYVALYNRYAGMVYRLAYSLLQHEQDSEEVLQDSFEYAFRKLAAYDPNRAAFKTWLYRITVSRCRNKRRRKWLPTLSINHLADYDLNDPDAPAPDTHAALNDRQSAVWKAIGRLSTKLREVAVLRYYGGLQYAEIAAILDIPTKTAESRMRLAHKALREFLEADEAFEL